MHVWWLVHVFSMLLSFFVCVSVPAGCKNIQGAKLLTLAWGKRCIFFVKDTETQLVNIFH